MTTLNTGADAVTVEFDFTPEDQVEFSLPFHAFTFRRILRSPVPLRIPDHVATPDPRGCSLGVPLVARDLVLRWSEAESSWSWGSGSRPHSCGSSSLRGAGNGDFARRPCRLRRMTSAIGTTDHVDSRSGPRGSQKSTGMEGRGGTGPGSRRSSGHRVMS